MLVDVFPLSSWRLLFHCRWNVSCLLLHVVVDGRNNPKFHANRSQKRVVANDGSWKRAPAWLFYLGRRRSQKKKSIFFVPFMMITVLLEEWKRSCQSSIVKRLWKDMDDNWKQCEDQPTDIHVLFIEGFCNVPWFQNKFWTCLMIMDQRPRRWVGTWWMLVSQSSGSFANQSSYTWWRLTSYSRSLERCS